MSKTGSFLPEEFEFPEKSLKSALASSSHIIDCLAKTILGFIDFRANKSDFKPQKVLEGF